MIMNDPCLREVQDFYTEELEVYMWDSDEVVSAADIKHTDKPSGLKR